MKWNIVGALANIALAVSLSAAAGPRDVSVSPQYHSTHVYVAPVDIDAFVISFTATFGGNASAQIVSNVMPVPASTQFRYIWTPVGTLSTFALLSPSRPPLAPSEQDI